MKIRVRQNLNVRMIREFYFSGFFREVSQEQDGIRIEFHPMMSELRMEAVSQFRESRFLNDRINLRHGTSL